MIACDPDPAGIEIASQAGQLWTAQGLHWEPWSMSVEHLASLEQRKPLTVFDRQYLNSLRTTDLPVELAELAQAMLDRGEKGEQEGLGEF